MAVPVEKEDIQSIKQLHYALPTTSSIGTSCLSSIEQIEERVKNSGLGLRNIPESQTLPVRINAPSSPTVAREQSLESLHDRSYSSARYPGMVSDSARRRTFHSWSYGAVQSVDRLVEAGFWYRGEEDKVTCFSCGKTMYNWECTDDPWYQHTLWSSHCEHVIGCKGQHYISRVLADQVRGNNTEVRQNSQEGEGSMHLTPLILEPNPGPLTLPLPQTTSQAPVTVSSPSVTSHPTIAQLSIIPHQPRPRPYHPDYSDINARRATYRNWEYSHIQSEEGLAKAGFFYKGVGDQVTCYQCGYTLHNWEETDSPWEEHQKWNPQCLLVLDHQEQESPAEGVTIRPESPIDEPAQGTSNSNTEEVQSTRKQKKKQKKRKSKKKKVPTATLR